MSPIPNGSQLKYNNISRVNKLSNEYFGTDCEWWGEILGKGDSSWFGMDAIKFKGLISVAMFYNVQGSEIREFSVKCDGCLVGLMSQ